MVLVDTDVLIDLLRGKEGAQDLIVNTIARGEYICASVITRTELLQGRRPGEEQPIEELFETIDWMDINSAIADRAGNLAREYRSSHPGVMMGDYLIAATALESGLELMSRNVKHYPMIEGLKPPY